MKFDFTDKASYLTWRQEWRDNYSRLSQEIRDLKRCRKQFIRRYTRHQTPLGMVKEMIHSEPNPTWPGRDGVLSRSRTEAAFQMERLGEAKALSWLLREDRRAREAESPMREAQARHAA